MPASQVAGDGGNLSKGRLSAAMIGVLAELDVLKRFRNIYPGWWVVLACSAIGAYGGGVFFYGFTILFNPLKDELGLTSAQVSLAFSFTRLEGAFEGAIVGFLIDRFGARRIMMIGVPLVGVGYVLWSLLVDSYITFLLVYVGIIATGMNGGFFHPALAVANNWFVKRRAFAMSIISVAVGIGGSIIVPLLAFMIANTGWRTAVLLSGVTLLVLIWPLTLFIRHSPEEMGLQPDRRVPTDAKDTTMDSQETAMSFHLAEMDKSSTLDDEPSLTVRQSFRTRSMWMLIAGITLRFTAHSSIMVHLAPILEDRGMSAVAAGGAVGLLVFLSIPGRVAVGLLGDRFSKRKVMSGLLLLQVLALLVLLQSSTLWHLYLFIVMWALSYGAGILNWAMVGDYFGRARFATLRGLMALFYSGGAIVGPVYAGWVRDTTGGYTPAILVFVPITFAAVVIYWYCAPPRIARQELPASV